MICLFLTASALTAFEWTIDMPTSGGSVRSIAVDSSDNLYATGYFAKDITVNGELVPAKSRLSSQGDFMLFSFTSAGTIRWFRYGGGKTMSSGNCIAIYRDFVYVTGQFTNDIEFSGGKKLQGDGGDEALTLVLDKQDNIVIGGIFYGKMTIGQNILVSASRDKNDAFVAKFSKDGKPLWAYSGGGKKWDSINSVVVDSKGTVYAGGMYEDTAGFGPTVLTSRGYASFFISKIK